MHKAHHILSDLFAAYIYPLVLGAASETQLAQTVISSMLQFYIVRESSYVSPCTGSFIREMASCLALLGTTVSS